MSGALRAVIADRSYLAVAVDCHIAAFPPDRFPDDTIPQLGRRFLLAHHGFYIDDPDGILIVAADDSTGRVAGLVLGGRTAVRRRFLRRHGWGLAAGVTWRALTRPGVRHRVFAGVRGALGRFRPRPGAGNDSPPPDPAEPWTFLYFLGTHPDFQGRGVGRLLVRAFEEESVRMGCRVMRLTAGIRNAPAIALYEKCGWKNIGRSGGLIHFERRLAPPA